MINSISSAIKTAARAVTLRHPNSMICSLWRKTILRTSSTEMGGLPTLGGMGVLSNEDELEFEYQKIGEGKLLPLTRFEGAQGLDDGSGVVTDTPVMEAQIAMLDLLLQVQKGDLIAAQLGAGVVVAFEVLGSTASISLPPAPLRYLLAPRDELHSLAPWQ